MLGRICTGFYPDGEDIGGVQGLEYGCDYLFEGLSIVEGELRQERIDCFRVAELLFKHAAQSGNTQALVNLGIIYLHNYTQGQDFDEALVFKGFPKEHFNRKAFTCFRLASEKDYPEAWYYLGDVQLSETADEQGADLNTAGEPAVANKIAAFYSYSRAYRLLDDEGEPRVRAGAALRLARCLEQACGCHRDLQQALGYYEEAALIYEKLVDEGRTWFETHRGEACNAVLRVKQELDGRY
ncbi:MAG: hypothetical protein FWF91_07150 [Coriobacteriia bacterium]|nr:hypothetical protein [Coriobacteriia bacterium]